MRLIRAGAKRHESSQTISSLSPVLCTSPEARHTDGTLCGLYGEEDSDMSERESSLMSGSSYSPWWRRFLQRHAPWLFTVCLGRNYHWRWDATCRCMAGCNGLTSMTLTDSVRRRKEQDQTITRCRKRAPLDAPYVCDRPRDHKGPCGQARPGRKGVSW